MALPRKAYVGVIYDGKDITEAVSNTFLDFEYTDKASDEADGITLNCQDRDGHWQSDWYPQAHIGGGSGSSDYSKIATALTKGTTTAELQRLIDETDLTPGQAAALQSITDSATWTQQKPEYRGEAGKIKLIEDIKGTSEAEGGAPAIDNAVPGPIFMAKIITENWNYDGEHGELDCGAFEIDTVNFSGPPDAVSIKAVSTPVSTNMRREEKTRAKEDTTLQEWAQDIAGDAGLQLIYEVESEIQLDRVDQEQKSDMAFLQELCHQYGVSVKVTNEKIVLFEESVYEQKPVVDTFDKSEVGSRILKYTCAQNTSETVCGVIASYKDPKSGLLVTSEEYKPPNPPATKQRALINVRPGDLRGDNFRNEIDNSSGDPGGTHETGFHPFNDITADFQAVRADMTDNAKRQARAEARRRNKKEWTCTLTMVGNVKMVSGANIELTNWGVYSGKYAIEDVTSAIKGRYTTVVKAHRVLVGY